MARQPRRRAQPARPENTAPLLFEESARPRRFRELTPARCPYSAVVPPRLESDRLSTLGRCYPSPTPPRVDKRRWTGQGPSLLPFSREAAEWGLWAISPEGGFGD